MEIMVQPSDAAVVVAVSGRLDTLTSSELEIRFEAETVGQPEAMILDLCALDYISSAGLRCILSQAKKMHAYSGRLLLAGLEGMVKEVFELSGFFDLLPVHSTREEALQALAR